MNLGSDYIITTDDPMNANSVGSPNVLSIKPFFTIYNEKNMLFAHPAKVGKTRLTLFLKTGDAVFDICVQQKTNTHFTSVKKTELNLRC